MLFPFAKAHLLTVAKATPERPEYLQSWQHVHIPKTPDTTLDDEYP